MSRGKLERFRINAERRNVIEPGKEIYKNIKGKWSEFFGNSHDLVLELGCGRGEYTTGLGALTSDKNFIGIDLKGSRIWKGSTVAFENNMHHVAFLRTMIQNLNDFFEKGEVSEIWVTFPDPRPKSTEERHRLTNAKFMNLYKYLLRTGGTLNFKTDNAELFDYTLSVVDNFDFKIQNFRFTKDLYASEFIDEQTLIKTTYEKKFLAKGMKINYLSFQF
jgi:tRNA (guanine-N7-)-methyltransferase